MKSSIIRTLTENAKLQHLSPSVASSIRDPVLLDVLGCAYVGATCGGVRDRNEQPGRLREAHLFFFFFDTAIGLCKLKWIVSLKLYVPEHCCYFQQEEMALPDVLDPLQSRSI